MPALSLPRAHALAEPLAVHLRASPVVESAEIVGDLRRWQEVIPAIELAAATSDREAALEHLGNHPMVATLTRAESDVARGVLFSGTPLVLHASPPDRFGTLLVQSTGHERHVQALHQRATRRGSLDRLQHACEGLFKGTEADILADGALDWPGAVLERLDVVIASIHQRHRQDEALMTKRLLRAIELPVFKIWGHPLGRIVLHREPIACRLDEILDAVAHSPTAIESNGDPYRLDLAPELVRLAAARGIRFVLSSDAHSPRGLDSLRYAVHMARRGRLVPRQVLNCLDAEAFATAVRPALPQATTNSP
jgi:histidinol phosphatase-like PHP family hydrolase